MFRSTALTLRLIVFLTLAITGFLTEARSGLAQAVENRAEGNATTPGDAAAVPETPDPAPMQAAPMPAAPMPAAPMQAAPMQKPTAVKSSPPTALPKKPQAASPGKTSATRVRPTLPENLNVTGDVKVPPEPSLGDADVSAKEMTQDDLLQYLDQVITWQRALSSLQPFESNPRGLLLRNTLIRNATDALRSAFDYAKLQAPLLPTPSGTAAPEDSEHHQQLRQHAAEIDQKVTGLQAQLAAAKKALRTARRKDRDSISSQIDALNDQIEFTVAQRELLRTVIGMWKNSNRDDPVAQIEAISRTVPELQEATTTGVTPDLNKKAAEATENLTASSGIFTLSGKLFGYSRKMNEIDILIKLTNDLKRTNTAISLAFRAKIKAAVLQSDQMAQIGLNGDMWEKNDEHQKMDVLIGNFRDLAKVIPPFAQEGVSIDSAMTDLADWRGSLAKEFQIALKALTIRLGILLGMILVPIVVGGFVGRAIQRYVRDARRRRQLHIIRRVLVSIVIALVILLSLVTEFGSLATFAGFLTAGIAVALQNVILSAVAYFFYFNRYGVRVGSRVSISGLTGDVVDIGLLRIYIMEYTGEGLDQHPTGRIAAFPNSVLFQNNAFLKQVPGTDYIWHQLSLSFPLETDRAALKTRLDTVVDDIYAKYPEFSGRQTTLENLTQLPMGNPGPHKTLEVKGEKLIYTLRYPVESERGSEIDQRLSKDLLEAVATDPPLKLLSSSFV